MLCAAPNETCNARCAWLSTKKKEVVPDPPILDVEGGRQTNMATCIAESGLGEPRAILQKR